MAAKAGVHGRSKSISAAMKGFIVLLAAAACTACLLTGSAKAGPTCDRFASPSGSDSAAAMGPASAIPSIGPIARIVPTSSPRSRDRGSPSHAWSFRADRAATCRPRSARATRADPTSLRGSLVAAHHAPSRASRAAAGRACRAASGGARALLRHGQAVAVVAAGAGADTRSEVSRDRHRSEREQ